MAEYLFLKQLVKQGRRLLLIQHQTRISSFSRQCKKATENRILALQEACWHLSSFYCVPTLNEGPGKGAKMQVDTNLADDAISLADGTDIHDIASLVAMYRTLSNQPDLEDAIANLEHSLRAFVARKRWERITVK